MQIPDRKVKSIFTLVVSVCAMLFLSVPSFGQERERIELYFAFDDATFRPDYLSNKAALERMDSLFFTRAGAHIDSVLVVSKSSPEGSYAYNVRLSERRAESMRKYLVDRYPTFIDRIRIVADGESWAEFRSAIESDTEINDGTRQRMLDIIDSDSAPDRKEALLKSLPTWRRFYREYFPEFRVSAIDLYFYIPEFVVPDLVWTIPADELKVPVRDLPLRVPAVSPVGSKMKPLFAVSTNLLYDLGGLIRPMSWTPNISVEVPIGQRWSVFAEYDFPWWLTPENNKAWQILKWDLGARWWFSKHDANDPMDVLRGHFLGLDFGAGYYDIEPLHKGYQGEFQMVGLEYGYAFRLAPRWRLDLFAGAGWLGTHYRYYQGTSDDVHLIYQHDGKLNWFGPTKAGVSIKYIFTRKARRTAK
jgi:hypothetical protein